MLTRVCLYARPIPGSEPTAADVASFEQSVAYSTHTKLLNCVHRRQGKDPVDRIVIHQQSHIQAGLSP